MPDDRYDLFGWDYEAINPLAEREVRWHLHWAQKAPGPVLGLACGTARLLVRLAEAGCEVTGIDLSETMLAIAHRHVGALPKAVRQRVRLIRQDMERFDLPERLAVALIADNSFRELPTRRQLLRCLRNIARHLRPDGRLLVVERRHRAEKYPESLRRFGWSEPKRDPATGQSVRRRGWLRLHRTGRRLSGEFEYEVTGATGDKQIVRCPYRAPVLSLQEYLHLFRRAGFEPEVFSDYGFTPGDATGELWCFVCTR